MILENQNVTKIFSHLFSKTQIFRSKNICWSIFTKLRSTRTTTTMIIKITQIMLTFIIVFFLLLCILVLLCFSTIEKRNFCLFLNSFFLLNLFYSCHIFKKMFIIIFYNNFPFERLFTFHLILLSLLLLF